MNRDDTGESSTDEKWLSVINQFEKHPELEPHGTSGYPPVDDGLDESFSESEAIYYLTGGSGAVWLNSIVHQDDELLLSGTLEYTGEFHGEQLYAKHQKLVAERKVGYLNNIDYKGQLATIEIPMDFDKETLEETVDAGVEILLDVTKLDQMLKETVKEY